MGVEPLFSKPAVSNCIFRAEIFEAFFLKIDMEIDRLLGKVGVGPQVKQACFSNSRLSFRFCLLD